MMDAKREALIVADLQTLMLRDDFKRFLFTMLDGIGMFSANAQSEAAALYIEGRRSVGVQMLENVANVVGSRELALSQIIAAELNIPTPKETSNGRRKRRDPDDGSSDDGYGGNVGRRDAGDGSIVLQY